MASMLQGINFKKLAHINMHIIHAVDQPHPQVRRANHSLRRKNEPILKFSKIIQDNFLKS